MTLFAKLCGSTNLHHTNILACGTKPYIIDLETVFYPVSSKLENTDRSYLLHSVLGSMIMPSKLKKRDVEYEFSILMDVREDGNAPVVDGRKVSVQNYLDAFKKVFRYPLIRH